MDRMRRSAAASAPRSSSRCRKAISTRPACCTGAASCGSPPRPTRSCRCAIRGCRQNPAYLAIIVLARVITKLGALADVDTQIVEGLFASDLEYLQRLYEEMNGADEPDAGDAPARDRRAANGRCGGRAFTSGGSLMAYPRGRALRGDGLHRLSLPLE